MNYYGGGDDEDDDKPKPIEETGGITLAEYNKKKENGEGVEDTFLLELFVRAKKRWSAKLPKNMEIQKIITGIEKTIENLKWGKYLPNVEYYDEIMKGLFGFKEAKDFFRRRLELEHYYQKNNIFKSYGVEGNEHDFPIILTGKNTSGKTEFVKYLARAFDCQEPIIIPDEFYLKQKLAKTKKRRESKQLNEPSENKKTERIITRDYLEQEIKKYKALKTVTELQTEKFNQMEK